jgi:hypothetical protein
MILDELLDVHPQGLVMVAGLAEIGGNLYVEIEREIRMRRLGLSHFLTDCLPQWLRIIVEYLVFYHELGSKLRDKE